MIMFPPWRFKLREAQVAFEQGRLEEAAAIAGEPQFKQFLPIQQLLVKIAEQFARRGLERAAAGDLAAGWRDLDAARQLAGDTSEWQQLSQAVADVAIGNIVHHLEAGDFSGASARIEALERRQMPGVSLTSLREVGKRLDSARKLVQRGKFAEATEQLSAAALLRPDLAVLEEKRNLYKERAERSRVLHEQLHAAMGSADWTKVLACASELLELSPENRVAHAARKRAWAEVGEQIGDSRRLGDTQHWAGSSQRDAPAAPSGAPSTAARQQVGRFMLWVDAVGGYLVCLGNEIVIGQSVPGAQVDVAVQADISRKHLKITRQGEGYVLEPLGGKVICGGKAVTEPTLISDGDELTLGEGVKMRFRKPHVLSASARLEMVSGHRTLPYADAVILMAESCVLGPKWQNHVVCRDWNGDVVLYRADDKIMCRAMESIEIDGHLHDGRGPVNPGSHVIGSDFSLTLEVV
jgi:hypothetical protein